MHRRTLLFALAAGRFASAAHRNNVVVVFTPKPLAFPRRTGIEFTRAYTACPEPEQALRALLTGAFPHVQDPPPSVRELLQSAGYHIGEGLGFLRAARKPFFCLLREAPPSLPEFTIVIWTSASANGVDSPSELSVKVPLLWDSGERAFTTDSTLVSVADFMPTMLAGVLNHREWVCMEGRLGQPDEWRAIVRGLDKLVVNGRGAPIHLYNLGQDPEEERDLIALPAKERTRDELLTLLRLWMSETNDPLNPTGLKKR